MERQNLDGMLVASETIQWLKLRRKSGIPLKLDFQKAYGLVKWTFLRQMMGKMSFGWKWISWIMACVSRASMSILLNGSLLQPFNMEKGLRQGDPL